MFARLHERGYALVSFSQNINVNLKTLGILSEANVFLFTYISVTRTYQF